MMMPGLEIHILRDTHERAEMTFDDGGKVGREGETFLPLPSSKCGRCDDQKKDRTNVEHRKLMMKNLRNTKKYKSARVLT
jgi:hypothetical protein